MTPETEPALSVDEHERQIQAQGWPGVPQLAKRWRVSHGSVRAIDRKLLPYLEFGTSKMRRYDPADVEHYEQAAKHGVAA